jgi:DNA-directed RNA polymerase subunit N (RpoN/RPB10)
MKPSPKRCLICGKRITTGIETHITKTHKMDYDEYRRYFSEAEGSQVIFIDESGQKILTITRRVEPS